MKTQFAALRNLLCEFWLNLQAGEPQYALKIVKSNLYSAIWWNYRCVQAWEIHYPATREEPARVVEVDYDSDEEVVNAVHYYLHPGCRVRIYVRYVSGKRKRIRLR